MIKNILIALLIGLLVGGVVLWHYLPAKVVEKEHLVMHYDTTYQTITKIKIVIKDTCHHNNDTSYADADSIIVVDTTTTGPDTVKIPVTVLAPTKTWSALPRIYGSTCQRTRRCFDSVPRRLSRTAQPAGSLFER